MRSSGELLQLGKRSDARSSPFTVITTRIPPQGLKNRLPVVLQDFRFILLAKCGHHPGTSVKQKIVFTQN